MSNIASHGIAPTLYRSLHYDALRDFTHIALIVENPSVFVATPRFPGSALADVVRLSQEDPKGVDIASSGSGSSNHLLIVQFAQATGARVNHVPYRGAGPAMTDVIAGVVPMMSDSLPSAAGHIRAGAVLDDQRLAKLFLQPPGNQARDEVRGAAGREGHDRTDRLRRPGRMGLRTRHPGQRQRGAADEQGSARQDPGHSPPHSGALPIACRTERGQAGEPRCCTAEFHGRGRWTAPGLPAILARSPSCGTQNVDPSVGTPDK